MHSRVHSTVLLIGFDWEDLHQSFHMFPGARCFESCFRQRMFFFWQVLLAGDFTDCMRMLQSHPSESGSTNPGSNLLSFSGVGTEYTISASYSNWCLNMSCWHS